MSLALVLATAACGSGNGADTGNGAASLDGGADVSDTASGAASGAGPDDPAAEPDSIRSDGDATAETASPDGTVGDPAPDPAPTTTLEPRPPRSFTLLAGGEILPHSPLWRGAAANAGGSGGYDFSPMMAPIAERVRAADLSICHLETPIAPEGEEFSTDPLYGVPPQIADAIAFAGFDRCSTASNHVLDRYPRGVDRTVDVLEAAGVGQSGMARTPEEIEPQLFDVEGVAISHLAYTYGTNGIPPPPDQPWRTRLLSAEQVIADAQAARDLGAEVVVVSLHWGTEKRAEPDDEQLLIADQITATGLIDLVIGHHAHVLQPIALVNGVWVVYGLGNLLSNHPVADHWPASTQDGALVEFEIRLPGDGTVMVDRPVVVPTWVDKGTGWVVRDVLADLADPATADWRRAELEVSLGRTDDVLGLFVEESGVATGG